jgi:hypothetical protein
MCRLNLTGIILILICILAFVEVKAQALAVSCDRSTIESYPESEKKPVLRYLDEARQTADEFMRLFADDQFDEVYKLNKFLTIFVKKKSNDEMVAMSLPAFRQEYGRLPLYEYRNQHLLYILNGPIQLRGTVGTWYELMTENSGKSERAFIWVETHKYRAEDKPAILSLGIKEAGKRPALPWEYYESSSKKPKGCVTMEDGLKITK